MTERGGKIIPNIFSHICKVKDQAHGHRVMPGWGWQWKGHQKHSLCDRKQQGSWENEDLTLRKLWTGKYSPYWFGLFRVMAMNLQIRFVLLKLVYLPPIKYYHHSHSVLQRHTDHVESNELGLFFVSLIVANDGSIAACTTR